MGDTNGNLLQPPLNWNDFSVNVPVTAGQQYTFSFTAGLGIPNLYGVAADVGAPNDPGPYAGGTLNGQTQVDATFQTWVDSDPSSATPEPSSGWLVSSASALLFFGVIRRRKNRPHSDV